MTDLEFISPRMLIVDDVDDNRDIMNRWFRRQGYEVVEAASGAAALALLNHMRFDIVLLDIMMPDMCGIETLKRIRETYTSEHLPVIMVSARADTSDVVNALEQGANDYVTKPINFELAKARVRTQISRKQALETLDRTVTRLTATVHRLERELSELRRNEATEIIATRDFGALRSHALR
jgi:DNA-binding response OmpR family regulator